MKAVLNYEECIKEFKKSLLGGSEFDILIDGIIKSVSTNRIRWFDVGIGDGHYLKKIVGALESKGFVVEVNGIDTDEKSIREAKNIFPEGKIVQANFSDLELKEKFDIFNFNQTIYYFHNKKYIVDKCISNLAEGGLLICVCWSKKDKMFQLHQSIFGKWTFGAFNSENFRELILEYEELNIAYDKYFEGQVDFGLWKNPENLEKNLYVISRIPAPEIISKFNGELANDVINRQMDKDIRVNGIVIAKKKYDIHDFTREKINGLLKNRLPSYAEKIAEIKGDLEALFMGSWEKETKYLADYVNNGRVLEICCAAGLKSVILAKKHDVVAIDISEERLNAAKENAILFRVEKNLEFRNINAEDIEGLKSL